MNAVGRFAHIDALRAFAVLIVVLQHTVYRGVPGDAGVTVFFGISGFIITWLMLRERAGTGGFRVGAFYTRRVFKLAPPFLALILLPTLVYGIFQPIDTPAVLSQVFFAYNWVLIFDPVAASHVLPGTIVVWSLAVEEQFYIAFALVWLLVARSRAWLAWAVGLPVAMIVVANVVRVVHAGDRNPSRAIWGTDARMDAIAIGVLAAVALYVWQRGGIPWLARLGHPATLAVAVGLFAASLAIPEGQWRIIVSPTLQVVAAVLVILYGLLPRSGRVAGWFDRGAAVRSVQLIGLASYSIYLVHDPLGMLIGDPLEVILPKAVANVLTGVAGVLVGIASYRLIEVPALRLRRRVEGARARRAEPAVEAARS